MSSTDPPVVGVLMGSSSDWETLQHAAAILAEFGVPHECRVVSAHRMPDEMFAYAEEAAARGLKAIIAGAGGAAHLPGMLAAKTVVPVLGVPVASRNLNGVDSLHSIVQMPKGVPVATFAIGHAGAANAALYRRFVRRMWLRPTSAAVRVVDALIREFAGLRSARAEIVRVLAALDRHPEYRRMMFSPQALPLTFSLMRRYPEFCPQASDGGGVA